jgi:hypothetical protein
MIRIVELRSSDCQSIQLEQNTPITNAFLNKEANCFYFIPVPDGKYMRNNESVFFGKANFLKLSSNNDEDMLRRKFYSWKTISERNFDYVVSWEVYTITGIKCQFLKSNLMNDPRAYMPLNEPDGFIQAFIEKLRSEGKRITINLIDEIYQEALDEFQNAEDSEVKPEKS